MGFISHSPNQWYCFSCGHLSTMPEFLVGWLFYNLSQGKNSVWPSKKTHMVRKSLKIKWNIINNLWRSQTAKEIKTRLKAQQKRDYSLHKSEGLSKPQVPCCWPQSFVQGDDPWAILKPYKISFESIKITLYMVTLECCYNPRATWETESGERPRVPGSLSNIVRFQPRNNGMQNNIWRQWYPFVGVICCRFLYFN